MFAKSGENGNFSFPGWALALIIIFGIVITLVIAALLISLLTKQKFWHTLFNILWVVFAGWELAIIYCVAAIVCFISIIFIPIGLQFFKLARLALWPFGFSPKFTKLNGFKLVVNIIWAIFAGWEYAAAMFIYGGLCCITVVLIPVGLQLFKFGRLVFLPLGTTITKNI